MFQSTPLEFVEPGLEQDRFFENEVAAAVGDAEAEAQPVIGLEPGFAKTSLGERRARCFAGKDAARAERRQARVDKTDARSKGARGAGLGGKIKRGERIAAEHRGHREVGPLVERRLGSQPVNRQPPFEIAKTPRFAVEQNRRVQLDHHEIVQVFALRGQQCGIARLRRADLVDIVGNEPLQKGAAIRPADREDAAVVEQHKARVGHGFAGMVYTG